LVGALDRLAEVVERQQEAIDRLVRRLESMSAPVPPAEEPEAGPPGTLPAGHDALWQRLGLAEGERRTVTVLFCDVSGFVELAGRLDPEEFQLVMRDTMAAIAGVITRFDGYIEKFIGDAVCAIFGAPVAHDDEPQRAARSALEINRVLAERSRRRPDLPELRMHSGINTGVVIAGTVGDGSQFGVMGDTINSAARLMNLAVAGEIFLSAETARRLRRQFRIEDRGLYEVKGKDRPVPVFDLLGPLAAGDATAATELRAPFVNRAEELAVLVAAAEAARGGAGSTVVLVGEPGVGKTRLVDETLGRVGAAFRVLRASARVVGEQALGVLTNALMPVLEEATGVLASEVGAVLASGSARVPPDFEVRLADRLEGASQEQPLLIVLEDVESADSGALELARFLSRRTTESPILWLVATRRLPDLLRPADDEPGLSTLRVEPLDRAATAALFDGLLPGAFTPADCLRLADQADGNPEFASEIALSLIDDGVVTEAGDGTWRVTGDLNRVTIPDTVAELVEARLDRVGTAARLALQEASVIGMRFSTRLLDAVASAPASLDAALAELEAMELLVAPDADDPKRMWVFRSHVVRQVAYDSILRRRRTVAHRSVADALTALEPDHVADNAELLASHLERSDQPARAIPHLRVACLRAQQSHSLTGAAERARRALRIRERFPDQVGDADTAWFLYQLGICRLMAGDDGGLADLEETGRLWRTQGDAAEEARLEERIGWYLTLGNDPVRAGHHLVRAQELAQSPAVGPPEAAAVEAAVAVSRAFSAGAAGRLTVAFDTIDGAIAEAREAGDAYTEARALLVQGVLCLWEGRVDDARTHLRGALDLAWAGDFPFLGDRCGRWLVLASVDSGHHDEALDLAEPLLARADERGDPSVAVGVRAAVAQLWREHGDLAQARALATEAVEIAGERTVAVDAAAEAELVLVDVALDAASAGTAGVEEASIPLERLETLLAADDFLGWRLSARYQLARGRAALVAGDPTGARERAAAARHALGRAGARRERLVADRLEGEARAVAGDSGGLALVEAALVEARELGSRYLISETVAALARARLGVPEVPAGGL
jgi:class 3 adenylate cyclase